jgi:hypothetical protein
MYMMTDMATVLYFEITQETFKIVTICSSGNHAQKLVTKLKTYTNL